MSESELSRHILSPPSDNSNSDSKREKSAGKSKRIDFGIFTVLVVDDEKDLREAIAFDLKRKGFVVLSAETGVKALKVIESNKVDVIVSDVRMPDGDGFFLLDKAQALEAKIPVILVTAFTGHTEEECLARGAIKVIAKPFERKSLMNAVIEALAIKR